MSPESNCSVLTLIVQLQTERLEVCSPSSLPSLSPTFTLEEKNPLDITGLNNYHYSAPISPKIQSPVRAHFERQSGRLALIRWVDHCRERRRRRWCSPAEDIKRRIMDLWKTLKIRRGLFRRGEVVNARSSALLKAEIIRPSEPTANRLHRRVNPHDSGDLTPVLQLSS